MTHLRQLGEDAGAERDERADAGHAMQPATGYCTRACLSAACPSGMVCSSMGVCVDGCDQQRPENCAASEFCNAEQRRCFPRGGGCERDSDCPQFRQLEQRGTRSCIAARCRFEPTFGESAAAKLATPVPEDGLRPVIVSQPSRGLRITDIDAFTFQFTVPTDVMVASILLRSDFKSLTDAADLAVWVAYLDHSQANAGVSLRDGGAVRDGQWLAASPKIPQERPLYFLALGYDKGRLVARSELIPFMIGQPLPLPGDACALSDGQFCAESSALICLAGACRTPCLSDDDCAAEALNCIPPGVLGVPVRVCG